MSKLKQMTETEDGWSDWVPPIHDAYRMACCDCGLVHDMCFQVVEVTKTNNDGTWDWKKTKKGKYRVMLAARRNNRSTGQVRRHKG